MGLPVSEVSYRRSTYGILSIHGLFFKILSRLSLDGTSQLVRRLDWLLLRELMGRELDLAIERDLLSAFSRMRFANSLTSTYDGFLYHVSQAGNCMVKDFA